MNVLEFSDQMIPYEEFANDLAARIANMIQSTHDDPEGGPELPGLTVISFVLGLLRVLRHLVVLTVQALRMDSSGNRPYEHDTSVAVIARERGLAGPGVQALPIIGTGETEAVLAAHSTMVQSSASISAWEASHPIWTPEVPTKAKAWFPIASWLALTVSPPGEV